MLTTNFKFGEVFPLVKEIDFGKDNVNFRDIFHNNNGGVSLLAFKEGQALATHLAPAEVMVTVLEGEIEFTMIDTKHTLRAGEFMLVGQGVPHSVKANKDSRVMLVKIKSDKEG